MPKTVFRAASVLAIVVVFLFGAMPHAAESESPITVHIFVGLSTGTQPDQIAQEQALARRFNAAHSDVNIAFDIATNGDAAGALATAAAGNNPPDIVGPVGRQGLVQFKALWATIGDLITANNVDMTDLDPAAIERLQVGTTPIAIPVGLYPSFLFVNDDVFSAAGIALPPTTYGPNGAATYNGKTWDMNALRDAAIQITEDKYGKFGDERGFDPKVIAVYGYTDQGSDLRAIASHWSPENVVQDGKPNFEQPAYINALTWYNTSIWIDHFQPSLDERRRLLPNDFASGTVAMVYASSGFNGWASARFNWSIAVAPAAPDGTLAARLDADAFAILATSSHKAAAFKVLTWLTGDGEADVCVIYSCVPARKTQRHAWETAIKRRIPQFDTSVIYGAIPYADSPTYKSDLPNAAQTFSTYQTVYQTLFSTGIADIPGTLRNLDRTLATVFTQTPLTPTPGPAPTIISVGG